MDFRTKRRNKKLARLFFTLAYLTVALFVTAFVIIVNSDNHGKILIAISIFTPLIAGITFAGLSQYFLLSRLDYRSKIKEYRQKKFFLLALTFIRANKLNEASHVYNKLMNNKEFEAFVFPLILAKTLEIGTDEQKAKVENKFAEIFDEYSPDKVKFNL